MPLHRRIARLELKAAAQPRQCLRCAGPEVVRIVPPEVVSRVGEGFVPEDPSDWCPCGRKVVFKIPPPVVARVGGG